jgi:hypothetical protein
MIARSEPRRFPRVFLVDADGKLFSVDARGELEKLLPELLAKTTGGASAQPARGAAE